MNWTILETTLARVILWTIVRVLVFQLAILSLRVSKREMKSVCFGDLYNSGKPRQGPNEDV